MRKQEGIRSSLAFVVIALLAVVATADCGDDPDNLFNAANCDFDFDIAGWTVSGTGATASWVMGDGDPEAGSVEGFFGSGGQFDLISPCAQVAGSTSYGMGARLKAISAVSLCFLTFSEYSSSNCSGTPGVLASVPVFSVGGSWLNVHTDATTAGSTMSVSVDLGCQGLNGGSARYDNLYFGVGLTIPVELTSFEVE